MEQEKRIWQYIDGELDNKARHEFEEEMSASSSLKERYETLLLLHDDLTDLYNQTVPETLLDNVMTRVSVERQLEHAVRRFILAIVAIMSAIGLLTIFVPRGEWKAKWGDVSLSHEIFAFLTTSMLSWVFISVGVLFMIDLLSHRRSVPR